MPGLGPGERLAGFVNGFRILFVGQALTDAYERKCSMLKKKMILFGSVGQFGVMRFPTLGNSPATVYFANDDAGGGGDDDAAKKEAEAAKAAQQAEWDKERQYKNELSAANKRQEESETARGEAESALDAANEKLATLEAEQQLLRDATEKAAADADDAEAEKGLGDYDNMIKEVTAQKKLITDLKDQQATQAAEIAEHQKTAEAREAERVKQSRDAEGMGIINQICADLEKSDKKFSAGDRNTVLQATNKAYKDGNIQSLGDEARAEWIKRNLRLEYGDAADARANEKLSDSDKKKKAGVVVDSGTGGDSPTDEIKEGDSDSVYKQQMARAKRRMGGGG